VSVSLVFSGELLLQANKNKVIVMKKNVFFMILILRKITIYNVIKNKSINFSSYLYFKFKIIPIMKYLSVLFFSIFTLLLSAQQIDIANSKVTWEGKKVTGAHHGEIQLKSGTIEFTNGALSAGNFVIDMTTITCNDLEGESAANLVNHLNSPDFFNTRKFKEASLSFTNVKHIEGVDYRVTGELTIKGITHPITFTADMRDGLATAKIKIDRTKYDIKYGSGSFFDNLGDKAIDDIFVINVSFPYTIK